MAKQLDFRNAPVQIEWETTRSFDSALLDGVSYRWDDALYPQQLLTLLARHDPSRYVVSGDAFVRYCSQVWSLFGQNRTRTRSRVGHTTMELWNVLARRGDARDRERLMKLIGQHWNPQELLACRQEDTMHTLRTVWEQEKNVRFLVEILAKSPRSLVDELSAASFQVDNPMDALALALAASKSHFGLGKPAALRDVVWLEHQFAAHLAPALHSAFEVSAHLVPFVYPHPQSLPLVDQMAKSPEYQRYTHLVQQAQAFKDLVLEPANWFYATQWLQRFSGVSLTHGAFALKPEVVESLLGLSVQPVVEVEAPNQEDWTDTEVDALRAM